MALTVKQQQILEAILFLMRRGEIPTVREVGLIVGLRSSATVSKHLKALEKEGLISISGKSRGIRLLDEELLATAIGEAGLPKGGSSKGGSSKGGSSKGGSSKGGEQTSARPRTATILQTHFHRLRKAAGDSPMGAVPLVARIAAGRPIDHQTESFLSADPDDNCYPSLAIDPRMFAANGELVALQIEGDSMVDAGILDGDYVIVRRQPEVDNGEIAAVFIDGEGTLKRLYRESANRGEPDNETMSLRLKAENDRFDPLVITEANRKEVIVFGKYVGLVRGDLQIL